MQLLQITTTPIKYELEIENAKLDYQQDFTPEAKVSSDPAELSINTKNAEIKIDTYEARKSLGLTDIDDSIKQYAAKGKEHISQQTKEYVEIGEELSNIQDGVDIGDIVRQKALQQPELYTTFLPSTGAELSCEPAQTNINYTAGDVNYDWQINDNSFIYEPGSVRMKIVEYGSVNIEYLGGPLYVPPSADPEFEETAE